MIVCSQDNMVYMLHSSQNCPGFQLLKEFPIHESWSKRNNMRLLCFSRVSDSTDGKKVQFLPWCVVHYLYHLRSNIMSQRKPTNTEKTLLSMIDFISLKTFLCIANTCK